MNRWHPLPTALYALVEKTPGTILLEASRPGASPISRVFTSPARVIEARTPADIDALFLEIEAATSRHQFAAGVFSYECGQCFEPSAAQRNLPSGEPLAWFGIYERCYRFDHHSGAFIGDVAPDPAQPLDRKPCALPTIRLSIDQAEYSAGIARIHDWIRAGDVYQLNFSFPLHAEISESPAQLYARLRAAQPVDYSAFLHCRPGRYILSLSPELFFHVEANGAIRRITTRPMKGTARRGRTTVEDRDMADWLAHDPKNRAENVMIVDLIRNDLGRICNFGTVQVDKLFESQRFPTLWQMTSTISGELRPDVGHKDILHALFPCGSVTGAPKIRAMQLLAQVELQPRGVYTGAIGFFSGQQSVFNVAIRTLTLQDGRAAMGIGSGVVIDSDPAAEFAECQLKAEFLTRSAVSFSLIETMRWDNGFRLIELHLDRLCDSADYFDFPFDREAVKAALPESAALFTDLQPRRVRLLLDADGTVHIDSTLLAPPSGGIDRICIASERTDPADRFLFHKTTNRLFYQRAFTAASAAGFVDVLFLNTREQITEGAIGNVFIEKAGRWFTPPIDCGVLPGVYRRYLLETRCNIKERILTLDDLQSADAIYMCNAVRGLRKVNLSLTEYA